MLSLCNSALGIFGACDKKYRGKIPQFVLFFISIFPKLTKALTFIPFFTGKKLKSLIPV